MSTPNKVLMKEARESLKGRWKLAIKVTIVYFVIMIIINAIPVLNYVASFIVSGPFSLGLAIFWLAYSRNQDPKLDQIFQGFDTWWRAFLASLLKGIYILLWSLLLIIPGIIAALKYSLTFYILADDKTIGVNDAIEKSKKMMYGYKWKLFCLQLRFLGWMLLCILTFGIGLIWLIPYIQVTMVKFYEDVKNNPYTENPVTA